MSSNLEQIKQMTTVVSDTGDLQAIEQYTPQDATTNPSLILKAAGMAPYRHLIDEAVQFAKSQTSSPQERLKLACQKLAVNFGVEILKVIPGRISTEIDARLSFDTQGTIKTAQEIIQLYAQQGIPGERVLIKIAATWEGIAAARLLEKQGIHCNVTLIFNLAQAVVCADAGVFLISPFVGRIYDWYKARENRDYVGDEDPGVQSVKQIYHYLHKFDYKTIVMGASFRNIGQIQALAGCDYLTISPNLLEQLKQTDSPLKRSLSPQAAKEMALEKFLPDEFTFRWKMNEDAMATEKLAEGIRIFAADIIKLEKILEPLLH